MALSPHIVGLVEKASKLALRYGCTYNVKTREFTGARSAEAQAKLTKWLEAEASLDFFARDK